MDPGQVDGSLIVEFGGWSSHTLTSTVLCILAGEVLGYPIAQLWTVDYSALAERMSSVGLGLQSPIHIDIEVWTSGIVQRLAQFANESYSTGKTGYIGRSGVYTTKDFVRDGLNSSKYNPTFSADFWKDYARNEQLVEALPVSLLWNDSKFFPPVAAVTCDDGVMGCLHFCSKSYACTLREQRGKECMVVIRDYYADDPGYVEAIFANHDIPAYFCFLGSENKDKYAVHMQQRGQPVVFYHWVPDEFHYRHRGLFDRIFFPEQDLNQPSISSASFGELGYGNKTLNPVAVDFPPLYLAKYAANLMRNHPPIATLLDRFEISDAGLDDLMFEYVAIMPPDAPFSPDKYFEASCNWVKNHYEVWRHWMDPLPMCEQHDIRMMCENQSQVINGKPVQVQNVSFGWKRPHPDDASVSYTCDGGLSLPSPVKSHFTCAELLQQPISWFLLQPSCDSSFYYATVSDCESDATRAIEYAWFIAQADQPSRSSECVGELPRPDKLPCDYLPMNSQSYYLVASVSGLVVVVLCTLLVLVNRLRDAPVLLHAQHGLLQTMMGGGLLLCVDAFCGGGKASKLLCVLRQILFNVGFTLIMGPLLVRSTGTYQLSQLATRRRSIGAVVHTRRQALRLLVGLLVVDGVLLGWIMIRVPPKPTAVFREYSSVGLVVEDLDCRSMSPPVDRLWLTVKALLAAVTAVISFLSTFAKAREFQEPFWICVASVVICVAGLLIAALSSLPFSLVQLATFVHLVQLLATLLAVGFLVVPKLVYHHQASRVVPQVSPQAQDLTKVLAGS